MPTHQHPEYDPDRVYDPLFVGRERELERLRDELFRRERSPHLVSIVGAAGVGKTAFLNAFFTTSRISTSPYWLDLHSESSPDLAIERFVEYLYSSKPQRQAVIVLDGAEYLTSKGLEFALGRFFNWKATRSVFIVRRTPIKLSRSWPPISSLTLGPLDEPETAEMFTNLIGREVGAEEVSNLFRQTNGVPLAVSILAASRGASGVSPIQVDGRLYDLSKTVALPSSKLVEAVRPSIITGSAELIRQLQRQPRAIYDLPPRAFEELLADILSDLGWEVHLTQTTRDGGKDILAYMNTELGRLLCLVEAKRYSEHRKVGVDVVRTLYGTLCDHKANSGVLITTSSFSKDAMEFRQRHKYQLALRDYADVTRWIQNFGTGQRAPLLEID